jgi:hypothetical protein
MKYGFIMKKVLELININLNNFIVIILIKNNL